MMEFKLDIEDDLGKKLKSLDDALRGKVARVATARASKVVQRSIQRKIHRAAGAYKVYPKNGQPATRQAGELAEALILKHLPEQERRGKYSVHKVTFSRKINGGIGHIAHLIEGGVLPHRIPRKDGSTIAHPGHRAFPFMQQGVNAAQSTAEAQIKRTVANGLREHWKKS